jgi:hypothetical protein
MDRVMDKSVRTIPGSRRRIRMKSFVCILYIAAFLVPAEAQVVVPVQVLKTKAVEAESEMVKAVRAHIKLSEYRQVQAQLIRNEQGKPDHYLVYLHSKTSHRVDFAKMALDERSNVVSVQSGYKLQQIDQKQQREPLVTIVGAQPEDPEIVRAVRAHLDVRPYRKVGVQLIRTAEGKPDHYLVYLHSKTQHLVEFTKLTLDESFNVVSAQTKYNLQPIDWQQQPGIDPAQASCPDSAIEFVAFAPNDIQLEQDVTIDVASAAVAGKLKTVKLLKDQATRDNYLKYMACPRLRGNFYDGDANPQVIVTVDGLISADDFKTVLNRKFQCRVTNIWLACEAYNEPMLSAVVNGAVAKKYAAGINDLLVGPSDKAGACAMKAGIAGKPLTSSFQTCYQQLDVSSDHWGFGGKGTDSFWKDGPVNFSTFGTIATSGSVVPRFGVGNNVDALTFITQDVHWGANLFYYVTHDNCGSSAFGTISTSGAVTQRFDLGDRFNALTFAAQDVGYGPNLFYYLSHDNSGFATFGTISTGGTVSPRFGVGNNFDALTFVAQDVGYGPNLFYYLSHDKSGFSTIGTISTSGKVTPRFGVGNSFDALTFVSQDVGYGPNLFYYLSHDKSGFTTIGTISTSGKVTPRFGVGHNFDALTFAAASVGYGPNLFYFLSQKPQ